MSQPYPPQGDPNQPPAGPSQPDYGYPGSSTGSSQSGYTPSNYSETPYGGQPASAPSSSEPQGYGAPPQQGHQPQVYGYGAPGPAAPARKPTMGISAFVLTVVATIFYCVFSVLTGNAAVELYEVMGTIDLDSSDAANLPPEAQNAVLAMSGFMVAQAIPALIGLVGFILGIVAAATGRGRVWGVVAIVLGVLGPIIGFMVFSFTLAPIAGGI